MKKILISAFVLAACSMSAIAQEQDSTRRESNEFRRDPNRIDSTEMRDEGILNESDSVSQWEERESTNLQQYQNEDDSLEQDAQQLEDVLREGAENTADSVENSADEVEGATDRAGSQIREDVRQTGDEVQRRTQEANEQVGQDTETASNNPENSRPFDDIEVVEDKEGPNNEVIYKYQGKLWYVDREKNELVEADKSTLKKTEHKVMVKEGESSKDSNRKGKKSGR